MPHSIDDWFTRLSTTQHATHTSQSAVGPGKERPYENKKSDQVDVSKPLCKSSTVEVNNNIKSAVQDLQGLCCKVNEGEPTEHAPFSYPRVVQSIELRSRNSAVKLLASPQNRKRKAAKQDDHRSKKVKKATKREGHKQQNSDVRTHNVEPAITTGSRSKRAAASAARAKFSTLEEDDIDETASADTDHEFDGSEDKSSDLESTVNEEDEFDSDCEEVDSPKDNYLEVSDLYFIFLMMQRVPWSSFRV